MPENSVISMKQSPSYEANSQSARNEIPRLLLNPKCITVFTRACHWSLSLVRWIQPTSQPIFVRSILMWSSSTPMSSAWSLPFRFPDQ